MTCMLRAQLTIPATQTNLSMDHICYVKHKASVNLNANWRLTLSLQVWPVNLEVILCLDILSLQQAWGKLLGVFRLNASRLAPINSINFFLKFYCYNGILIVYFSESLNKCKWFGRNNEKWTNKLKTEKWQFFAYYHICKLKYNYVGVN